MVYSKTKKILFVLLCLFIILFPFALITKTFATETEELEEIQVQGISISSNSNYFQSSSSYVSYIPVEKGYIYHIYFSEEGQSFSDRFLALSSEVPALNVPYQYLGTLSMGETYDYMPTNDGYFLCCYPSNANRLIFTREPVTNMDSAVFGLVDDVGINSIWNIFDISINYIVIVVLVAFGIFIITRIIRKISKGKEGL